MALGDENRQRILIQLLKHYGGMRVGNISNAIGLSRPATSHHLKILKDSGIVEMYKIGTKNFYHVGVDLKCWQSASLLFSHVNTIINEFKYHQEKGFTCPIKKKD